MRAEFHVNFAGDVGAVRGEEPPETLVRFARAFLMLGRPNMQFVLIHGEPWRTVRFARIRDYGNGSDTVHATIEPMTTGNQLTRREIEVLTLIACGSANAEISRRLGTSTRTVTTQIDRIMRKLDLHSRAALSSLAVDSQLLALPIPGETEGLAPISIVSLQAASDALDATGGSTSPSVKAFDFSGIEEPVRIGTLAATTGYSSSDAMEHLRGTAVAVESVNAAGGVLGRRLDHVVAPANIDDPKSLRSAMQKLVEADVDAITGSYVSADNSFLLDIVSDYGRPFLHLDTMQASADLVRENFNKYSMVFQTCPTETHYIHAFTQFLEGLDAKPNFCLSRSVGVIEMDAPSAQLFSDEVSELVTARGWTFTGRQRVPTSGINWRRVVAEVISDDPSVLFVVHFSVAEVIRLQQALVSMKFRGLVYYVYSAASTEFARALGSDAENVVWSSVTTVTDSAISQDFRRRYVLRYGSEPGAAQASAAFDQVELLHWAWLRSGTVNPASTLQAMRGGLFRGLNGTYFLGNAEQTPLSYPGNTNDPTLGLPLITSQIQDGKSVMIAPEFFGTFEALRLPGVAD